MKFLRESNLTQRIGYALILVSLFLGVMAVSQEMAVDFYAYSDADITRLAILPPLQVVPTDPLLSEPDISVNQAGAIQTATPEAETTTTPVAAPEGLVPDHITISSIHLYAPIIPVHYNNVTIDGQDFLEWNVPSERAAGWHDTSAKLGQLGNIVLNGHHNEYGYVFAKLVDLKKGDQIIVSSGSSEFMYEVNKVLVIREEGLSNAARIQNASWISPTPDERLTLVSCWPPGDNTHRVIVVAFPIGK